MAIVLLPALAPDPANTNFPVPRLIQSQGSGGSFTYEGPLIAGQPMPGQWLLTRVTREFGWQQQAPGFMGGAGLVPSGLPLAEIEYSIRIWESGTAGVYRKLLGGLFSKAVVVVPGQNPGTTTLAHASGSSAALSIDDPSLKDIGITTVVVKSVTPLFNPLVTSGGKGPWTATVVLIEYREPVALPPLLDQKIPESGAVTPSAANNLATANAAVAAGDKARQAAAARQLLR